MSRANALYEGIYLLGTSIARPLIAKRQIEIAEQTGADAVSHGATGKGNDQVRFELGYVLCPAASLRRSSCRALHACHVCRYYGLKPDIKVISPWREWDLTSRSTLIRYAESRGIEVPSSKRGEPPFSMDANLLHISYEGLVVEHAYSSCQA